jgi:hypothetical protein
MNANNGRIQVADKFKHLNPIHNLTDSIAAGNFHSIRMAGKNWKIQTGGKTYAYIREDDGSPLPNLDVVIVGIHPGPANSRVFYPGAYQEDSTNPPTCASLNGVVPDPGVPIPQHKTCNGCPNDQWKPNRGGKDCKEHKRVAIVPLPYMKTRPALEKPLAEPVFFKVPPASLKIFKAYCDSLQARGAHFASVITRVSFNPEKQFELAFAYLKPLTNNDADLVLPLLDDPATKNIIGSMQEYKQIAAPVMDAPQETGFAAAFGKKMEPEPMEGEGFEQLPVPAKRGRGRPKKVAEEDEEATVEAKSAEVPAESEEQASAFEESQDSELDSMMNQVLGSKIGKMMS